MTQLKLHVDNKKQGHKIFRIQSGDNEEMIAIIIQRNEKQYMVLAWDLSLDYEISSFDIEAPFMVQLDHDGNVYVVHKGLVSFCN